MTDDLVKRLRADDADNGMAMGLSGEAADRIEAQAAEIERLTYDGIHTCHDECQRVPCRQRREIERLRKALEDAEYALVSADRFIFQQHATRNECRTEAIAAVRAALGDTQ